MDNNTIFQLIKNNDYDSLNLTMTFTEYYNYINLIDVYGNTPLMVACCLGFDKCIDILLKHNAYPLNHNFVGLNALALAAFSGNILSCMHLMNYCKYNKFNQCCLLPPICAAIINGHLPIVKYFSKFYPKPNKISTQQGITPLMFSILYNKPKITEYLLNFDSLFINRNALNLTAGDIFNYLNIKSIMDISGFKTPKTPCITPETGLIFNFPSVPMRHKITDHNRRSFTPRHNQMLTPNISPINTTQFVRKSTNSINTKRENDFDKKLGSPLIVVNNNNKFSNSLLNKNLCVENILKDLKMSKYIDIFAKEEIDYEVFVTMNEEDLRYVGISNKNDCHIILSAIEDFKNL